VQITGISFTYIVVFAIQAINTGRIEIAIDADAHDIIAGLHAEIVSTAIKITGTNPSRKIGIAISIAIGIAVGIAVSVAIGIAVGVAISIAIGVAIGISIFYADAFTTVIAFDTLFIVFTAAIAGIFLAGEAIAKNRGSGRIQTSPISATANSFSLVTVIAAWFQAEERRSWKVISALVLIAAPFPTLGIT
jgi:hypothetical protein